MPVTNYYTVGGELLGERTAGGSRTDYLTDALGSVVATVNPAAQVVNTYRYKPYGALLVKTGVGADPAFRWVGRHGYRQTGKKWSDVYVRARHYDTATGRWTTTDPFGFEESANAYIYVDAVNAFDPLGLQKVIPGSPPFVVDPSKCKQLRPVNPCIPNGKARPIPRPGIGGMGLACRFLIRCSLVTGLLCLPANHPVPGDDVPVPPLERYPDASTCDPTKGDIFIYVGTVPNDDDILKIRKKCREPGFRPSGKATFHTHHDCPGGTPGAHWMWKIQQVIDPGKYKDIDQVMSVQCCLCKLPTRAPATGAVWGVQCHCNKRHSGKGRGSVPNPWPR